MSLGRCLFRSSSNALLKFASVFMMDWAPNIIIVHPVNRTRYSPQNQHSIGHFLDSDPPSITLPEQVVTYQIVRTGETRP
jgi:hypothetical protein